MDQQAPQQAWHELPPSVGSLEQLSHAGRLPGQHVPCGESTQKIPLIRLFKMLNYFGGPAHSDPSGANRVPEIMSQCGVSCATYAGVFMQASCLATAFEAIRCKPSVPEVSEQKGNMSADDHSLWMLCIGVPGSMLLFMTSLLSSVFLLLGGSGLASSSWWFPSYSSGGLRLSWYLCGSCWGSHRP